MTAGSLARKMHRTLEPYHAFAYFSKHVAKASEQLGLDALAGYFAMRAAPMGPMPAEVVIATFYNFNPDVVRAAIPAAWQSASPATVLAARDEAVDAALREALGEQVIASDEMRWAAETARTATDACTLDGRPLFAGFASLDWPDQPHLVLWHAISLLREHRGDGHIAALVTEGIDGCEALVTDVASGTNAMPADLLKLTRGWPGEAWAAAEDRLRARGLLAADGGLTDEGTTVRRRIEAITDERAAAPWQALGAETCTRLRDTVRPWSRTVIATGPFADGADTI